MAGAVGGFLQDLVSQDWEARCFKLLLTACMLYVCAGTMETAGMTETAGPVHAVHAETEPEAAARNI